LTVDRECGATATTRGDGPRTCAAAARHVACCTVAIAVSPRLASLSPTLAFTACCLTVAATVAATVAVAQPLPAPAAAPAPAPGTSPVMPTPLPGATPWSPVDDEGWPRGVSLEDLRGLRPCDLGERLPGPGEPIPCRPMARPEPVQWRWGLDWTVGAVFGRPTTTGASHALGVEVDVTRARSLALGVRYELGGYGLRGGGDEIQLARGQRFLGQVRWRAFTDEVDRDAWAVVAGAGYQLAADALGGDGPVARVGLAREIGLYLDDENAGVAALELAYSRGLTADAVEAVTASARFGFELNIVEPRNVHRVDRPWSERAWTGADVYASPFMLGLGVSLGARLSPRVHAVATGNYVFGRAEDSTELEGLHGALAVQAGVRLGAGWPAPGAAVRPAPGRPRRGRHRRRPGRALAGRRRAGLLVRRLRRRGRARGAASRRRHRRHRRP
jgi:hypothetical protein